MARTSDRKQGACIEDGAPRIDRESTEFWCVEKRVCFDLEVIWYYCAGHEKSSDKRIDFFVEGRILDDEAQK